MTDWFGASGFIPHGFCLAWDPELMAAVVLSNGLIALAFMTITVMLIMKAARPGPFMMRWLYRAYAVFIFWCGVSHVLDDVTFWFPIYRLQAIVLGITAMVSLFTAVLPMSVWVANEVRRFEE